MAFPSFCRFHSASLRRFSSLSFVAVVGAALLITGCKKAITDPKDPNFIVAEKGDWKLTRADLDKEVNAFLQQRQMTAAQVGPADMLRVDDMTMKSLTLKKLLLDKAAALPADDTKDFPKEEAAELDQLKGASNDQAFQDELKKNNITLDDLKKNIHEKVLITAVMKKEIPVTEPSQQEIDDIYMKNKDKFQIPASIRVSRILVLVDDKMTPAQKAAKKKIIDAARARVAKGEDFSKVATEVSEDQYSKARGGDMGYTKNDGEDEPGFDEVAFASKVGVVSPVFETPVGYQFIKVTDSKPAGTVPIADARAFISGKLKDAKAEEQQKAYVQKVLADSGVIFHLVTPPPPAPSAADAQGAPGAPQDASGAPAPDASAGAPPQEAPAAPAPAPDQATPAAPSAPAPAAPAPAH